ncbi:hypothetical protein CTM93_20000 [Photobacterium phosphoreum]|uniref:hypothetical protein n=1 Tax=Photobacterium phosphoreum TaxID=659 RepID=UPI000D180584|nr:hypothetical protein [Photobacterium phosphoreum]PSU75046.1 hypothetical protein CTM93_20000 [Photobacterium phosphoreum]
MKRLIPFLIFSYVSCVNGADINEDKIISINNTYAKCLDAVHGNFKTDLDAQNAMRVFYQLILKNTYKLINDDSKETEVMISIFGGNKDVFAGAMLAGFIQNGMYTKEEKNELSKENGLTWKEWRELNQLVWRMNGCSAILDNTN